MCQPCIQLQSTTPTLPSVLMREYVPDYTRTVVEEELAVRSC